MAVHSTKVDVSQSPAACKDNCCEKVIGDIAEDYTNGLDSLSKKCRYTIVPGGTSCEIAQGIFVSCVHFRKKAPPSKNSWNDAQCRQLVAEDAPQCHKVSVRTNLCQKACFEHIQSETQKELKRSDMDVCAVGVDRYLQAHALEPGSIEPQVLELNTKICSCVKGSCPV